MMDLSRISSFLAGCHREDPGASTLYRPIRKDHSQQLFDTAQACLFLLLLLRLFSLVTLAVPMTSFYRFG